MSQETRVSLRRGRGLGHGLHTLSFCGGQGGLVIVHRIWSFKEAERQGEGSVAHTPCTSRLSTISFCLPPPPVLSFDLFWIPSMLLPHTCPLTVCANRSNSVIRSSRNDSARQRTLSKRRESLPTRRKAAVIA